MRNDIFPDPRCFHSPDIDILVLGTIGVAHARNPHFGWIHLDSILHASSPELLLVQIRQDHFLKQEYFDGPPEMAYLAYVAGKMMIECRGIDWWQDMDLGRWNNEGGSTERIANIYKNIQTAMATSRAQMIMIAVDISIVDPISKYLVLDNYKEWRCPRERFTINKYPDLPREIIDFFRDGTVYLISLPDAGSPPVQKRVKDLYDIIGGKGYLFKR
jgi:hypothetical protein